MNRLPWFRAYTEMVDDEKLRLLSFEDRWHFVAILCLKGQGVLDASDALMMRKVAVKLGLDVRALEEVARRLAEVGLINQETLQPTQWDARQKRSDTDPTAADRKRRQREKASNDAASKPVTEDVTRDVTEDVTHMSRVTRHDVTRTDIDKEEEEDKKEERAKALLSTAGADDDCADDSDSGKQDKLPACPHLELIDLYGKALPNLPQPRAELWTGARKRDLAARWKWTLTASKKNGDRYATTKAEALSFFERYFAYASRCPMLNGENARGWCADLAWLSKEANFAKVLQGNYEKSEVAA